MQNLLAQYNEEPSETSSVDEEEYLSMMRKEGIVWRGRGDQPARSVRPEQQQRLSLLLKEATSSARPELQKPRDTRNQSKEAWVASQDTSQWHTSKASPLDSVLQDIQRMQFQTMHNRSSGQLPQLPAKDSPQHDATGRLRSTVEYKLCEEDFDKEFGVVSEEELRKFTRFIEQKLKRLADDNEPNPVLANAEAPRLLQVYARLTVAEADQGTA